MQAIPQELAPPDVHENEPADVARMRSRDQGGRQDLRPLSRRLPPAHGNFARRWKRWALEDMWRYAIDAASFDWMGDADHDNGGGKEYTWWLVQKTTDLYHSPKLATLFTYERSVSYPHGHRNVMFPHAGRADVASARGGWASGRRRHGHALWLFEGTRRHLRLAYVRHWHGYRLARREPGLRTARRDLSGASQFV